MPVAPPSPPDYKRTRWRNVNNQACKAHKDRRMAYVSMARDGSLDSRKWVGSVHDAALLEARQLGRYLRGKAASAHG